MQRITPSFLLKLSTFCFSLLFLPLHTAHAVEAKMKVVASISPLADFVRQVGGTKVEVVLLLPPGASPHTYEPTPKAIHEISQSRIFFKIGSGLEFWADRMIKAAAAKIDVVDSSEGVDLITSEDHHHGLGHTHLTNTDPHIWLDPVICIGIIDKIEAALSKADPSNALYYRKNASVYRDRLRELDREIAQKTRTFRTREYVTFHSAWNYFSRRYGLKVAAAIEEVPGKEPSPKHVAKIIDTLRKLNTRVIFAEPQFSPKIAETIAKDAGAHVLFLDPEGGQKGREGYISLMKYNLAIMEKALK